MKDPEKAARDTDEDSSRFGTWLIGVALGAAVLLAMLIAYQIGTTQSDEETVVNAPGSGERIAPPPQPPGGDSAADDAAAQQLFVTSCGSCHTLSDAGTDGVSGPNLDDLQPDSALVLSAIEIGGAGSGAMPAGLLTGPDAEAVSEYVAAASGSGG
jgi:mono/diheme cytochrome c family protein